MSFNNTDIKTANEELEKRILDDRASWINKIKNLISDTKDMNKLTDSQIQMLSYRQIIIDKIADFKTSVYKRKCTWDRYFKDMYRSYSVDYSIKLTGSEKAQFISGDMASLKLQIKLLENHVEFYQECIKTLDNLAFAIRNRIRLNEDDF